MNLANKLLIIETKKEKRKKKGLTVLLPLLTSNIESMAVAPTQYNTPSWMRNLNESHHFIVNVSLMLSSPMIRQQIVAHCKINAYFNICSLIFMFLKVLHKYCGFIIYVRLLNKIFLRFFIISGYCTKKKNENKMFTKLKDMWQKLEWNLTGHYLSN